MKGNGIIFANEKYSNGGFIDFGGPEKGRFKLSLMFKS